MYKLKESQDERGFPIVSVFEGREKIASFSGPTARTDAREFVSDRYWNSATNAA